MRNAIKYIAMLFMIIASFKNASATAYYSRTSGGNWNDNTTWSTVTYGNATNVGTYPKTGDSAYIGDSYTVILNLTQTTGSVFVGQGSSGILEFSASSNYILTIQNNINISTNGKIWYNGNSSRTHGLVVGGNLTNNGTLDLYADADDICNLTFNRSTNATVTGSGTFDLNSVTLSKTTSTSFYIDIQSTTFESAIRDLVLTYGTYYHNNSSTFTVNPSSAFTINADVNVKISQGAIHLSSNNDDLTLNGIITITGGTFKVGSTAGAGGIKYDKTGSITPKIDISAGTLDVYGGITYKSGASTDPVYFTMSGGTIQLNTGSTGTSGSVFRLNDVAGSTFIMTDGTIILSQNNTTGVSVSDFSICGNSGSVSVGGGTIQFGDENTEDGTVFNFTPVSSVALPNLKISGSSLIQATLCPSNNSVDNIKALSLYIDANKTFDIRSCSGTTGDTRSLILTGNYDGVNTMVLDGTMVARSSTFLLFGGESQMIGGTGSLDFYNLEVNNSYGVTALSLVTINNQLTLTDGILYSTGGGTIKLASGATTNVGSNSSHIDGSLIAELASTSITDLYFPIGKDGIYRPINLQVQHDAASSVLYQAEVLNSSPRDLEYDLPSGIERVSAVRYYSISRSGAAGLTSANITLDYNSDDWVNDENYLRIAAFDGSTSWIDLGGVGSSNPSGNITSSSFSTFRTIYTLANASGGSNPLPVSYTNFEVERMKNFNSIRWTTASESNSDHFEIERSNDAINFSKIGTAKAAGFSNEIINYSFEDHLPSYGIIYYRLKQIDFNGEFSYSPIKAIITDQISNLNVFPNPAPKNGFVVKVDQKEGQNLVINIYNNAGTLVCKQTQSVEANGFVFQNESRLSSGIYYVKLFDNNNDLICSGNVLME